MWQVFGACLELVLRFEQIFFGIGPVRSDIVLTCQEVLLKDNSDDKTCRFVFFWLLLNC